MSFIERVKLAILKGRFNATKEALRERRKQLDELRIELDKLKNMPECPLRDKCPLLVKEPDKERLNYIG